MGKFLIGFAQILYRCQHQNGDEAEIMNISELNKEYGILKSGSKYRIIKSFRDYDNYPYDEGNIVEFLGCSFLPYEDGLSLFCKYQDRDKQIRLQVRPEAQQVIAHNLEQYFQLID